MPDFNLEPEPTEEELNRKKFRQRALPILIGGNALDAGSTYAALKRPGNYEANRALPSGGGAIAGVKAGATAAQAFLLDRLAGSHPKLAQALGWALGGLGFGVGISNMKKR